MQPDAVMYQPADIAFVVLAGGQGSRMQQNTPKQFLRVAGKTILEHTVDALLGSVADSVSAKPLPRTIVVVPADALSLGKSLLGHHKTVEVIAGGSSRQGSTLKALQHLRSAPPKSVVIHDAARPFVSSQIVHDVIDALQQFEAVDVAISTTDTVIVERDGFIQSIPKRNHLLRGQTPQGFRFGTLLSAYQEVGEDRLGEFTDDCGIYLECNPMGKVRIVEGSPENIKVTDSVDLVLADELFRMRCGRWTPDAGGMDVRDKRALVFGGTRGIGQAITQVLESAGCKVAVASRSTGCDIADPDQVERTFDQTRKDLGHIDFVVNSAGLLARRQLHLQSIEEVKDMIGVNFLGALNVARASHDRLQETHGMLLQFSSSSYTRGRAEYTPYSASKAAVVNLTQGLAEEWQADGIRVNCVVPGRTDTPMRRSTFGDEPARGLQSPYEVALTACRLLSTEQTGMVVRI